MSSTSSCQRMQFWFATGSGIEGAAGSRQTRSVSAMQYPNCGRIADHAPVNVTNSSAAKLSSHTRPGRTSPDPTKDHQTRRSFNDPPRSSAFARLRAAFRIWLFRANPLVYRFASWMLNRSGSRAIGSCRPHSRPGRGPPRMGVIYIGSAKGYENSLPGARAAWRLLELGPMVRDSPSPHAANANPRQRGAQLLEEPRLPEVMSPQPRHSRFRGSIGGSPAC